MSRDLWECEGCGAVLGIAQIKVKMLGKASDLIEETKEALSEDAKRSN